MGRDPSEKFIVRWKKSGGGELANSQSFLAELCELLKVAPPNPTRPEVDRNDYVFERDVVFQHSDGTTSNGRIDLYKRGCFVLESKQGVLAKEKQGLLTRALPGRKRKKGAGVRHTKGWDEVMDRARGQAESYVRALPPEEGRPPFILVVDVGHSIEFFSEFSMSGGNYVPFPDSQSHRIYLHDLADPEIRQRLRRVWDDPLSLDPSRRSARVTREIAGHLADLAKSLEASGNRPKDTAKFLMRCLFTMFAEDVELLPKEGFTNLLAKVEDNPALFKPMAEDLWLQMKKGGFSSFLMEEIRHFNGYLFAEAWALDLDADQVSLLKLAAKADWREVEPAIFGTLLERALDPVERHRLGAHYTPRAYVERLVMPTIIEPLRDEWEGVKAAAFNLFRQSEEQEARAEALGNKAKDKKARDKVIKLRSEAARKAKQAPAELRAFHKRLCATKVLDPACGSGNFLYVSMEHMKRLEGEVLELIERFGHRQEHLELDIQKTVSPHQFLGLELNPRAAEIAQLVLWIGYLQWHLRTYGETAPPEPIIRDFKNIECRDAVLAYDRTEPVLDKDLNPVTRWDGRTYKKSPVTGQDVPDESATVLVEKYINPRKAQWPQADYVVGNPPFMGISPMRQAMGDGYVETIRKVYDDIPGSCDYVLYWWNQAAHLARSGKIRRFGFITTNSIKQTFNRRLVAKQLAAKKPLSIIFAIPDHPWVDSADGAAVRIAMTVGQGGNHQGILKTVVKEEKTDGKEERRVAFAGKRGKILADLTIGADVAGAVALQAMADISCPGVKLHGSGFIVTPDEAQALGLDRIKGLEEHIRDYRNGRDLTQKPRGVMVIDLFGLEPGEVQQRFPEVYQRIVERVKPERDQNKRKWRREHWWLFGEPISTFRPALKGLPRYLATVETSKHRFFVFLDKSILPDNMLVNVALDDPYYLGVLSSSLHITWALAAGGRLGMGNDPRYNKTRCFETFPFPDPSQPLISRIRDLGERLDAHRKRQQKAHPDLTMTGMYNVLVKLKSGEELSKKEREINQKGLVSVLKQIHQELDGAVFEAYGWPTGLSDEEILERLVALNHERAAEEAEGRVRWLRPEYQSPEAAPMQPEMIKGGQRPVPQKARQKKEPWPKAMAQQAQAVRRALQTLAAPAEVETVAKCFVRAKRERVAELLETLASLGQAQALDDGRYLVT